VIERLGKKHRQPPTSGTSGSKASSNGHSVDVFDELLTRQRPFGDSEYLIEQLHARYRQRLGKISSLLPVAGSLSSALEMATPLRQYRTMGDPVVRHAVHQALRHASNGDQGGHPPLGQPGKLASPPPPSADGWALDDCEEVLRETLGHLESAHREGGPLESGGVGLRRLGRQPGDGSIWSEEHGDDLFGRSFRKIVHDNFQGEPLCTPSAADLARLAKGAELLGVLMPLSARSVLSHMHLAVIVPHTGGWKRKGSCSEYMISGTIFLNREMLRNPWWVAEHLLHEALHQKLYDFRHTHSLLMEDLSPEPPSLENAATVHSIWNVGGATGSSGWDTFRAVAAFHVYVHLAVLCVQIERRKGELLKRFGPADAPGPAMTQRREAFERAQYLGRHIKQACWQELGPAGRMLVAWLTSILNALDPAPPPSDTRYLHLVLNRYMAEATLLANRELSPEVDTRLAKLADDEAGTIRRVLIALHPDGPAIDRLNDAVARRQDEGTGVAFLRFRRCVTGILHVLSPDGYGLRHGSSAEPTAASDEMVCAMVDGSSQQLTSLLDGSSTPLRRAPAAG